MNRAATPLDYDEAEDREVHREARIGRLVVSACTAGGAPDRLNEDSFAVAAAADGRRVAAGVFDGVTSLRPIPALAARGVTGARFASHLLKSRFAAPALQLAPAQALLALNAELLEASLDLGARLSDTHSLPASTATLVVVDGGSGRIEAAHVGDSFVVAYGTDGGSSLVTRNDNEPFDRQMRERMRSIAAARGITPREAMATPEMRRALLEMYDYRNNRPDGTGCGVVNGDPAVAPYIHAFEMPLDGVDALLVGTDGLVPPDASLDSAHDRARLREVFESAGLTGVIRWKRAAEDADPDWRRVRYKHSDDATGVVLKVMNAK